MRYALLAGEKSGDLLGASLIRAIKQKDPEAVFYGVGGDAMSRSGLQLWHDYHELAHMGLVEVLRHLPSLLALRQNILHSLLREKPDVFIGIDAPDFNFALERKLRKHGIPCVHYVSPSVWAWRSYRIKKISRSCDRMLCLFPFEQEIYQRNGLESFWVGHPFASEIPAEIDKPVVKQKLGLKPEQAMVALLPGSRTSEINRLWPLLLATAEKLLMRHPGIQFMVPAASNNIYRQLKASLQYHPARGKLHICQGQARDVLMAADLALLASGTAALEAMLCNTPMVVCYRIANSTYQLVRFLRLMQTSLYSLPNALHGEKLVPELMQENATVQNLFQEALMLLENPQLAERQQQYFTLYHRQLDKNAPDEAARRVIELAQVKAAP